MKLIASTDSNYSITIDSDDLIHIDSDSPYFSLVKRGNSLTYSAYDEIPSFAVKNQSYNSIKHEKTTTFDNQTTFLLSLDMAINIERQESCFIAELIAPSYREILFQNGAVYMNCIPQICELTEYGYIIGIDGDFDFGSGWFKGSIRFADDYKTSSN